MHLLSLPEQRMFLKFDVLVISAESNSFECKSGNEGETVTLKSAITLKLTDPPSKPASLDDHPDTSQPQEDHSNYLPPCR